MILIDENAGSTATVEYVFKVLSATYGEAWNRSLGKAPIADVMTIWANALDGVSHSKSARKSISWALSNLPDRPPNSREFLALCRQSPAPSVPQLPEPQADPARVAAELAKLVQMKSTKTVVTHGLKNWAKRLQARHEAGERLNANQIRCYRNALNLQEAA